MFTRLHHFKNFGEHDKRISLGGPERIGEKERNDLFAEIFNRTHTIAIERFFVIIVPIVDVDPTTTEELLKCLKSGFAFRTLGYDELREHLPSKFHNSTSLNRDREANFAVNESNDPADCSWPFLLIVCTHHIVTAFRRVV